MEMHTGVVPGSNKRKRLVTEDIALQRRKVIITIQVFLIFVFILYTLIYM